MTEVIDTPLLREDIPDKGAANGHLRFAVKSRTPQDVALATFCANIAATLLFERMQAQGTNIIVSLNKDNAQVDVLARAENDGLDLHWDGKQLDPGQMNDIQEKIKNKTFFIGKGEAKAASKEDSERTVERKESGEERKEEGKAAEPQTEEEEDYLVKQLHRIQ